MTRVAGTVADVRGSNNRPTKASNKEMEVFAMPSSLMIVDDSATMRKIIMRTIRLSGINFDRTEEAGNGKEALDKLCASPVDVILCDVNMPEMNGPEMVKRVRQMESCKNTKIVMVSSESSQDLIDQIKADGANGYITKPFTPEQFKEKLSPILN
jgi:two-component system chemotaxis response regulator CheY